MNKRIVAGAVVGIAFVVIAFFAGRNSEQFAKSAAGAGAGETNQVAQAQESGTNTPPKTVEAPKPEPPKVDDKEVIREPKITAGEWRWFMGGGVVPAGDGKVLARIPREWLEAPPQRAPEPPPAAAPPPAPAPVKPTGFPVWHPDANVPNGGIWRYPDGTPAQ